MSLDFEPATDHEVTPPDEFVPAADPEASPTILFVKRERMQEEITRQMNRAVAKGRVVGWASAVSRFDGAEAYDGVGGLARKTQFDSTGTQVLAPAVPMTVNTAVNVGSCSKTIMAVAAVAAEWAVATRFGTVAPPGGLAAFQATCLDTPLAHRLPKDFKVAAIDGTGRYAIRPTNPLPCPPLFLPRPQPTVVTLLATLQFLAYLSRGVTDRFTSTTGIGDSGHYQNLQECVDIGPVLNNADTDEIGRIAQGMTTAGRYSNQAYGLMRIVIPYILGRDPGLTGTPAVHSLDAMLRSEREIMTSLVSLNFIKEHVLGACGVTAGDIVPRGDVCYYGAGDVVNEFCEPESRLLSFGGGGWYLSAVELRNFLTGVQRGLPFKGVASWWTDVIKPLRLGMDPEWLSTKDNARANISLPGGNTVFAYTKAGGENFPSSLTLFPAPAVKTRWLITEDGTTAVIVQNSSGKSTSSTPAAPDPYNVLVKAYLAALS